VFPYIDLPGVQQRSVLRPSYFNDVETQTPGFTAQSIASHSSGINSRLRKRYGKSGSLPFGQGAPALVPSGLTPPAVSLTGRPTLGSLLMVIGVTTPGALGTMVFEWSQNGGVTFTEGVMSASAVLLGTTGMTALFPADTYDASNAYAAAPPVPETILKWLTFLVTEDVATRHGINPNDPLAIRITEKAKLAEAELLEAANTQTGLFDLPSSEDEGSAIDTGGPRGYSQQSPYEWTYLQAAAAYGRGRGGLGCARCGCLPCACPNSLVGS
jgi:hypothetical protein